MTRQEMLDEMGISDDNFREYLRKYGYFLNDLNPEQKAFHLRNNSKTIEQVARSLGPEVRLEQVEELFEELPPVGCIVEASCCKVDDDNG